MSEKSTNSQQRRRVTDSTSKNVIDNKIQERRDRKPITVDASQNGRPSPVGQPGRDRGGRGSSRRDDDRDTRAKRDKPLSAKAESYKPVHRPDNRTTDKHRLKEGVGKSLGGIPVTSSSTLSSSAPVFSGTPPGQTHGHDAGQMKVHFGVIKGMPYEFTSNSASSVTPRDMRKYGRKLFADNSHLSILVRRVLQEDDRERERRLNAFRQLREFLEKTDNAREVYKQTSNLLLVLHEVLLERSQKDIKREASQCITILGWQLRYEGRRFFNWIFTKLEAAPNDEIKLFLLHTIVQTLSQDTTHYYKLQIPMVMTNLQTALENAEAPVVLLSVMSVIHYVAEEYPDIFINNFKDTVDILVGWHIDTTQSESVIKYCSDSLISFHQFWLSDIEFSSTLLGQFLEDMNAYAEDLMQNSDSGSMSGSGDKNSPDEEIPSPDVCRAKILALLRVFTTVVKSLGDEFTPLQGPPITYDYLSKMFTNVIECIEVVQRETSDDASITLAGNECLSVVCDCVKHQLGKFEHTIVPYVLKQLDTLLEEEYPKTQDLLSPLQLLFKAIFYMRASFPSNITTSLLGPQSKLRQLRFQPNKEVLAVVLRVYQSLLCVKDIPMLENVYSLLLADLEIAYNALLVSANSSETIKLAPDNPFAETSNLDILEAKTIAMFDLNAFMEIASAKSSIIGMWALSPSLFDLLSKYLIPTHMPIAEHFPAVHYTLLNTLFAHAQSHGQFISSAFGSSPSVKIPAITSSSPKTSGHFSIILSILGETLPHPKVSGDSRKLCMRWFSEILKLPQLGDYAKLYERSALTLAIEALLPLAHDPDQDICLAVCSLMQQVMRAVKPTRDFLIGCVETCKSKLVDSNVRVMKAYTSLLEMIPADVLLRNELSPLTLAKRLTDQKHSSSSGSELDPRGLQVVRLARSSHITRSLGTFHPHDFKKVMAYILLGEEPSNPDWLERMYYSCQKTDMRGMSRNSDILMKYIDGNQALQWFWATWESAQMCVLLKLRTPLGKPQETFRAIEAALLEYCRDTKTGDPKCQAHGPTCQAFSAEYTKAQIRPVLLLQFLEHLEKLMYNAYEGSALAMTISPKAVRTFFRTNRVTCQDWLRTIRPIAATAASNVGQHAVAIRHGLEMINDLMSKGTTQSQYFEDAVEKVVCSCVQLHCPQPILGLMSWCQESVGRALSWISACVPAAEGKYETCAAETIHAIKKYLQLDEIPNYSLPPRPKGTLSLKDSPPDSPRKELGHPDGVQTKLLTRNTEKQQQQQQQHNNHVYSHHVAEYLLNQVTQCYISVSDWSSAVTWQQAAIEVRSHVPNQKHIELTHDMNAIKALGKFEDRDFVGVAKHLDLIPGLSLEDLNPEDVPVMNDDVPDLEAVLDRGLFEFVRALSHYHLSGCYQAPISVSMDNVTYVHPELNVVIELLQTAHKMGVCGVQTAWLDWPAYPNQGHTILMQSTKALINTINGFHEESLIPLSSDLKLDPSVHDTKVIGRATQVMKYQYYLQTLVADDSKLLGDGLQNQLCNLQLATAQLARKQGNLSFAQRLLHNQIKLLTPDKDSTSIGIHGLEIQSKKEMSTQPLLTALKTFKKSGQRSMKAFHLDRECAKLSLALGNTTDAWTTMANCIVDYATHVNASNIDSTVHKIDNVNTMSMYTARSLLNLVQWFQGDYRTAIGHIKHARSNSDAADKSSLAHSLSVLLDMEYDGVGKRLGLAAYSGEESAEVVGSSPAISENDAACGRLLHLAVMQAPDLAKGWATLASWCYRWGRKAVDIASSDGGVQLTDGEKSEVLSILPAGITNSETDGILEILSHAHCSANTIQEDDIIEQMQSAYNDGRETTRLQLLAGCPALQTVSPRVMDQLLDVWNCVCRRIFSHYRLAARGYFKFLKLAGVKTSDKKTPNSNNNAPDVATLSGQENYATQEDGNITATLRLLRLLVKYAGELRDVLEDGLANTPTAPWKSITPQLFSRLNHPEAYVRQSISDLMCRVAVDSPHLIVYQAVVGSPTTSDHKKTKDVMQQSMLSKLLTSPSKEEVTRAAAAVSESLNQSESAGQDVEKSMEEEERNRSMSMLEDCLQAIVSTLSKHNPKLVCQVEVLVQELRRITVLWEELWLGTLTQLHVDVTRRLHQLEDEVKRVKNNDSLSAEEKVLIIAEKHNAIMKPIVYALEQVHSITSEAAETPNEKSFQDAFQTTIEKALTALKSPKDPSHPHTSWTLFKQLQGTLQQRATKRATFMLHMSDISPRLSSMRDTIIPLPGLTCQPSQVVNINCFAESVNILPTKTKPKKLVFVGNDGKRYTYLFKGLEDLHLDERIMQFLAIVNTMFGKNKRQDASLLHACHYSVTPLGPRSGLIQWVDGATALFGLYKRWQQREALAVIIAKGGNSSVTPAVQRPSEVFYSKMTPALKDAGLSDGTSRKDWPMIVMKDVINDLMADTPKDLLAKELWCSSGSASEWWYITQAYSRSTAVMSIIGYIIGLGDRHLDNVLVNFLTGDVVHIDYNVCFEKGKNLRVPERVPFRMTQNIECALGVTGVEGTFRHTAEEVLKIMRKGRETLLTLLEAFVYDPLVDWTTGNEAGFASAFYGGGQMNPVVADGGEKKREMEKEITRSLFSSRVAEMKGPWFKNRDAILEEISKLEDILKSYLTTIEKSKAFEANSLQHKHQAEILQVALGDKNHSLHSLGQRYSECSKLQNTRTSILQAIQDKMRELEHWHTQHKVALETARGQHLTAVSKEMGIPLELGAGAYIPVVTFLKTAGQTQVISQCEHVETELCNLVHQRRHMLRDCVEVLQAYCTLAQQFPVNFAELNRAYIWQQWLQELICDFSATRCDEILDRYQDHFSPPEPNKIQQVVSTELKLQALASDANSRLLKAMDNLKLEQTERPHAEASAQQYEVQINKYIQEKGDSGSMTLMAVIMNVMSSFCKRSLIMEGAVASAGDLLVDFTTRNGNWFLEELCSMINNLDNFFKFIYFCSFPSTFEIAPVFAAVECFRSLKNVYSQLHELHSQFKKTLTPLVVKNILSEDPSVPLVLKAFNDLCQNPELPLQKVAYQIEQDMANVTLGMQTELTSSKPVQLLRSRFRNLTEQTVNTTDPDNPTALPLSAGQSLLASCNAVFQQLLVPVVEFVAHMEDLPVPQEWRRVDVIQDAKGLKATVLNANTQDLLMDMFFVKQLQALNEFFLLCRCYAAASQGDQEECNKLNTLLTGQQGTPEITALLFTESQLVQPIKKFLAHYIRKQILGIATQVICLCACTFAHQLGLDTVAVINIMDIGANSKFSIDLLIKKAVEVSIQKGYVHSQLYSLLNNITSSYDTAWRAADQARQLNISVGLAKEVAQRAQSQFVRYQWLHEDILQQAGHQRQNAHFQNPPRSSVMSDLRKRVQLLGSLEGAINAVQERSTSLHASISQRLKWAAGANPSLNAVLKKFDTAVNERNKIYATENKHSTEVSALSNAILHFEALRTRTTEAMNAEANFLGLLNRTLECCEDIEASTASVTELEEGFIRLKAPTQDQPINHKWMRQVLEILKKKAKERDKKMEEQKMLVNCGKDALHTQIDTVKNALGTHHKLMSEVKGLLKTIAREEEEELSVDGEDGSGDVRTFMMEYKSFSEEFTNMLKVLLVGSSDEDREQVLELAGMMPKIKDQAEHTKRLYDHLVSLADPLLSKLNDEEDNAVTVRKESGADIAKAESNKDGSSSKTGSPTRPPPGFTKPTDGTPATPPTTSRPVGSAIKAPQAMRDPRTGKMLQVRNTHAINVWRRVKGKLDGRDPDSTKRLSVAEQIDFVIKEATSMENLATLYEGWTAWV